MHERSPFLRRVLLALALAGAPACRAPAPRAATVTDIPRLALLVSPRSKPEFETQPTPLSYGGGFLNKTLVFETLVRLDRNGALLPGLAESWSASPDRRDWTFELRPDARFHAGIPCDAEAVRRHVRRWLGDPDDAFIPAASRIESVEATGPRTVVFHLREPFDLPYDLAIINPMAVVGPLAERGQAPPVLDGTGPFRVAEFEPMERFLLARNDAYDGTRPASAAVELRLYPVASPRDAIGLWALRRGQVDAWIEDWVPRIPRRAAIELVRTDDGFVLERVPGSATLLLTFNADRAPFSDADWRRRVAGAIDREALVRDVETGLGTPAYALFAPGVVPWPSRSASDLEDPEPASERAIAELLVSDSNPEEIRAALLVAEDLRAVGVEVELLFVDGGEKERRLWARDFDLSFAWTWGVPYDPQTTLYSRLGPQPEQRSAVESPPWFRDPELARLVLEYACAPNLAEKSEVAGEIQAFVEREAALVPLYVPDRIAVRRRELQGLSLDVHGYEIEPTRLRIER